MTCRCVSRYVRIELEKKMLAHVWGMGQRKRGRHTMNQHLHMQRRQTPISQLSQPLPTLSKQHHECILDHHLPSRVRVLLRHLLITRTLEIAIVTWESEVDFCLLETRGDVVEDPKCVVDSVRTQCRKVGWEFMMKSGECWTVWSSRWCMTATIPGKRCRRTGVRAIGFPVQY